MKSSSSERSKRASREGTALVSKSIKAMKLFNKGNFRWQVAVNEHPSEKLASNSDDEKKMSRAETAERKAVKDKRRWQQRASSSRKPSRLTLKHFGMICRILQSFFVQR